MKKTTLTGLLLDEHIELSLIDISQACSLSMDKIIELVEEGVLEPKGDEPSNWRFRGTSLGKARAAMRLQEDLGVNLAGVALVLDLLDELEALRSRLCRYEMNRFT